MWRTFAVGALFGALAILACWLWPQSPVSAALIAAIATNAGLVIGGALDIRAAGKRGNTERLKAHSRIYEEGQQS